MLNYYHSSNKLPKKFGSLLINQHTSKALLWQFFASVLLCLCIFQTPEVDAAIKIESTATLQSFYKNTVFRASNSATVTVIRFEDIGFYRYDTSSTETYTVHQSFLANQDSISCNPSQPCNPTILPNSMEKPINPMTGGEFALPNNGSIDLPLTVAGDYNFGGLEPIFIVARGVLLPASVDSNGRAYIAVTVNVDNGNRYVVTLVETVPNSKIYVGYLQANTGSHGIDIPPASSLTIEYNEQDGVRPDNAPIANTNDYVNDTDTITQFSVPAAVVADVRNLKTSLISSSPIVLNDLFLTKVALQSNAVIGDFVQYELKLVNNGHNLLTDIELTDVLPQGFRLQPKSVRIDGQMANVALNNNGDQAIFSIASLAKDQTVTIRYVVEITTNSKIGNAVNRATARSGVVSSNVAAASVMVESPFYNDRAFLLGRIIVGECGDDEAEGLENIRIYMEDGTNVITDKHGRWHIEGVMPGTHVLQVDTLTLGQRYQLRKCFDNTRQAGNKASRFVNVQGGTLWRENWYVEKLSDFEANIAQHLTSKMLADGTVQVTLPIQLGEKAFEKVTSQILIPESLEYVQGSTTLNGQTVDDLVEYQNQKAFIYTPKKRFDSYTIGFRLAVDPNMTEDVVRSLIVESIGETNKGEQYQVLSTNRLGINRVTTTDNNIVLRPKFGSLSAAMSNMDLAEINQAIVPLRGKDNIYLTVTGHSDNQAIRFNPKREINDNYALSKARAQAVADYLAMMLKIDASHITVEGKGSDFPVADNKTEEGRAKNRRVSVQFRFTERASDATVEVVEGDAGTIDDIASTTDNKDTTNEQPGFVNLVDGATLSQAVFSAIAQIDSQLDVQLFINDEKVSNGRIGMTLPDVKTGMTRYTWVGLELKDVGEYRVKLQGVDPFGIVRFVQEIKVRRSSRIKTIRLEKVIEATADGRTPIAIKVNVLDEFDKPVRSGVQLQIVDGQLNPLNGSQSTNLISGMDRTVHVDSNGILRFDPVGTAGNYRITLAAGDVKESIEIPVAPELRDWILVGYAEGSAGYNALKGNMRNLDDEEKDAYVKGDTAFFARGKVKGEWLLTAAYDSRRRDDDSPLMQRIDPEKWYVLYGDDTVRNHDAPSSKQLYVRIEKSDYYALFGDYDTGLNVTELSSYQRTLTGLKTEYRGKYVSAMGFAAQSNQGFIRDDIAADGTSGLYRLSQNRIVPGSDEISIEIRDRFTNEVLETQTMSRYADYNIDYIDGTLYFRTPILVQDENFNPQRIVAKYEVDGGQDKIVAGGRVSVHDADKKIEVGLNTVKDDTLGAEGKLGGVDVTWKPNQSHTVKAEAAMSDQDSLINGKAKGKAGLIEYTYTSEKLDARARTEQTASDFGLGQIAQDDGDMRKALGSVRYRFNEQWSINGDANYQELLSNNNQRSTLESRVEYNKSDWKMYSGLRHAEDKLTTGTLSSEQVIAGAQKSFLDDRLGLSVRGETGVSSDDNVDYPSLLSLGGDYRVTNNIALFANQDFTWGPDRRAQETRAGVRSTPWSGGTITTDVSRAQDEYGPRLLAHAGVMQTVNFTPKWSGDFGFDRSQTLQDNRTSADVFDDRRPTAFGTNNDDYTAVYAGAGYRDAVWQLTNRIEYRHADTDDKWTFMSGFNQRLDDTDTLAGRVLHFNQKMATGDRSQSTELDLSYAHRPLSETWYWLNRTKLVFDALNDSIGTQKGKRVVNNTHLNNTFDYRHQLSLQYGMRYVFETIDDERYKGFTDLIAFEYRFDITEHWDIGMRGSTMASYNSHVRNASIGIMAGYSPVKDVWISLGYNFKGYYDNDFDGAGSRMQGIVLDFRVKFDQNSVKAIANRNE